jgi:hypothetical protein
MHILQLPIYFPDKQKDGKASVKTFLELSPVMDFFKGMDESAKLEGR